MKRTSSNTWFYALGQRMYAQEWNWHCALKLSGITSIPFTKSAQYALFSFQAGFTDAVRSTAIHGH